MKKSILKNYLYNVIYQIVQVIVPIILIPYTNEVLGLSKVGMYSYTNSIVILFSYGAVLGFGIAGSIHVASVRDNPEKLRSSFFEILISKSISSLLFIIIFIAYVLIFVPISNQIYFWLQGIFLLSSLIDITWFYTGNEDLKNVMFRNILIKVIGMILIFAFVKGQSDFIIYIIILSTSQFFGQFVLWFDLKKYVVFTKKTSISSSNIYMMLWESIKNFLPQNALMINTVLSVFLCGLLTNSNYSGQLDLTNKLITMCIMFFSSLGMVVSPRISYYYMNNEQKLIQDQLFINSKIMLFFALPIVFGIFSSSELIVSIFLSPEFNLGIALLSILALRIVIMVINDIIANQYLIPTRRSKIVSISILVSILSTIILNFLFIILFGPLGSALALVSSEIIMVLMLILYSFRELKIASIFIKSWKIFVSSVIMYLFILIFSLFRDNVFNFMIQLLNITNIRIISSIVFLIQITIGFCIYLIFSVLLKEQTLFTMLDYVKMKLKKR